MKITKITADSLHGRVLIALRAGRMDYSQIRERVPASHHTLAALHYKGLIEKDQFVYQITPAGRAACPNRRDSKIEPMHARKSQAKQQGATA